MPTPVPLFNPASSAVYGPGGSVIAIPDSSGFVGARPAAVSSAAWAGSSCQSSLKLSNAPSLLRSSSVGFARALGTPSGVRLGPIPRATILSLPLLPPSMNPAITILSAVSTKARVLMLASFAGTAWLRSYTSIKPTPKPLLLPLMITVYAPRGRVA